MNRFTTVTTDVRFEQNDLALTAISEKRVPISRRLRRSAIRVRAKVEIMKLEFVAYSPR